LLRAFTAGVTEVDTPTTMEWLEHILAMVGLALIAIGLGHFKGSYEKKQNETQKISVRMDKERV
jgi:hypothetical protein